MDKEVLKLGTKIQFWYQHQPTKQNFNESFVKIACVDSVEAFWGVYQHCKRPSQHEDNTYLYLFREGIKPVWQDPANQHGGTFVLRFEKQKSNKVWEDIALGFVAINVGDNDHGLGMINGIRSKSKKDSQIIEVWIKDGEKEEELEKVRDWIIKCTFLNNDTAMEFIPFKVE